MTSQTLFMRGENLIFSYAQPEMEHTYKQADVNIPAIFALNGLDIQIVPGEFIAILGHNGSGKSTLARHLNALLTPSAGTLWVSGMDTRQPEHTWDIRQQVGMVFQNPDNQLIASIVEEDVAFGPENLGVPSSEIRTRVDSALETVHMSDYALAAPYHLSGGQKIRVAIAGVLAMRPSCIVLDEPTAMLDPSGRREVLETVTRLNKESGITIILITHFMEEAVSAGRVIVMENGKITMDGTPNAVFKRVDEMKALGLDVPQAAALAHSLRCLGVPVSENILTINDFLEDKFITNYILQKQGQIR